MLTYLVRFLLAGVLAGLSGSLALAGPGDCGNTEKRTR